MAIRLLPLTKPQRQSYVKTLIKAYLAEVLARCRPLVKMGLTGKGIPPKEVGSDTEVMLLASKNASEIVFIDLRY